MKTWLALLRVLAVLLGPALAACTTTYTESELASEEAREDKQAQAEEKRDRKVGEEGGVGGEELEDETDELERENDL